MENNKLEENIALIQAIFPLRSRRECQEILEVVNDDIEKALAFLAYLGPRIPDNQTQEASVEANSQKRASAQGVAGGDVYSGQEGVLNLRSMKWTPLEMEQRSTSARNQVTNRQGALPSMQVDPQRRATTQGEAGGDVYAGQQGVLDLRNMEWTPLEMEQRSALQGNRV